MTYRYLAGATVIAIERTAADIAYGRVKLDFAGQTDIDDNGDTPFETRRTTVAACRRQHSTTAWRPEVGDRVLIDGEFLARGVTVDAIAPDLAPVFPQGDLPSLGATFLADIASRSGAAHKLFRQDLTPAMRRIRCVHRYVEREMGTGLVAIAHLDVDIATGRMRAWSVSDEGRGLVAGHPTTDLDEALAVAAGTIEPPAVQTPTSHLERRTGEPHRTAGPIDNRRDRLYRPGATLEDALRRAGIDPRPIDDSVPFETFPIREMATAGGPDDDVPF